MRLAISNLAWSDNDKLYYEKMRQCGFLELEVAPTKIISDSPYEHLDKARDYASFLYQEYGISCCSIQSIWYKKTQSIFDKKDASFLKDYSKKACDFALALGAKNLVFGCPKNRNMQDISQASFDIAKEFFFAIAEYARKCNLCFGLEANPKVFGTNFINTTAQALAFIKEVNNTGLKLNLDMGTVLENGEDLAILKDNVDFISHVHISENKGLECKALGMIQKHNEHSILAKILQEASYKGAVSIEMLNIDNVQKIQESMDYIKGVFA